MYGAREILIDYLGISLDHILIGVLQHGEGPSFTHKANWPTPRYNFRRSALLVANKETKEFFSNKGIPNCRAIGSIWCYLDNSQLSSAILYTKDVEKRKPGGILFIPRHWGWFENRLLDNNRAYLVNSKRESHFRSLFESLRHRYPQENISCCVYWTELIDMNWSKLADQFGINIVTAGVSITSPPWAMAEARIRFLYRLYALIASHEVVIAETFSSAIFYALNLLKPVSIFDFGKDFNLVDNQQEMHWLREFMPEIFLDLKIDSSLTERANNLLGFDSMLPPEDLLNQTLWIE